jgi:hypothetical protein
MFKELFMNPVIIGVIAGIIAYNYMSWKKRKLIEKKKKRGKKINPQDLQTDIIIPSLVAIIVWFIAFGYSNYNKKQINQNDDFNQNIPQYKLVRDSSPINQTKSDDRSFTLITNQNDIMLPTSNKVPGVFVDLYK